MDQKNSLVQVLRYDKECDAVTMQCTCLFEWVVSREEFSSRPRGVMPDCPHCHNIIQAAREENRHTSTLQCRKDHKWEIGDIELNASRTPPACPVCTGVAAEEKTITRKDMEEYLRLRRPVPQAMESNPA